jgi:hypothetical protein
VSPSTASGTSGSCRCRRRPDQRCDGISETAACWCSARTRAHVQPTGSSAVIERSLAMFHGFERATGFVLCRRKPPRQPDRWSGPSPEYPDPRQSVPRSRTRIAGRGLLGSIA